MTSGSRHTNCPHGLPTVSSRQGQVRETCLPVGIGVPRLVPWGRGAQRLPSTGLPLRLSGPSWRQSGYRQRGVREPPRRLFPICPLCWPRCQAARPPPHRCGPAPPPRSPLWAVSPVVGQGRARCRQRAGRWRSLRSLSEEGVVHRGCSGSGISPWLPARRSSTWGGPRGPRI